MKLMYIINYLCKITLSFFCYLNRDVLIKSNPMTVLPIKYIVCMTVVLSCVFSGLSAMYKYNYYKSEIMTSYYSEGEVSEHITIVPFESVLIKACTGTRRNTIMNSGRLVIQPASVDIIFSVKRLGHRTGIVSPKLCH